MKRIIISAADETFRDPLIELLSSLHQWDEPLADAIGVLDVGLSAQSLAQIEPLVSLRSGVRFALFSASANFANAANMRWPCNNRTHSDVEPERARFMTL